MRILAENTMVLVIDFQERLVPVMAESEQLIANTTKLLCGLDTLGVPMVVSQQYTKGLGMTVPSISEAVTLPFSYYDKLSFSCAEDTAILDAIEATDKKNIIICGIEAHICVLQTVIDLLEKGYQVILVEDCVSSRKESDKNIALKRAVSEGAILTTCESILFELTRKAGSDTFKTISKLIK